ncbi:DUF6807 family protein [Galbibacter sp.]|jgi:hypothetical protein|uniref:DUF6807 family protein n=1 Tax=Galbibacter sp. TaxID=2918471 RepID=UPI003A8EC2E0
MKATTIGIFISLLSFNGMAQELHSKNTPQGVLISEGDQKVLFYQKETKTLDGHYPRANYIHPLYDLEGNIITEDFPEDHKHHRGIFWAWHQVLVSGKPMGDSWECKDFTWDVQKLSSVKLQDKLQLHIMTLWNSPDFVIEGNQIPFIKENTQITVHPATDTYRIIDFKIALQALVDGVQLGGSNDIKGYGGFSARFKLPSEIEFISDNKNIEPQNQAIQAGRGMQFNNRISPAQELGVLLVSSTSNPKPNNSWILRLKNSMQNAVYPGAEPVSMSKESPTILQYRLVIYNTKPSEKQLLLWQDF